jgi:hypothetical protein
MIIEIKYRYKGFDYLVADKVGNLFVLPYFNYRRTTEFKQLKPFINGNKKAIKYKQSNISFLELKRKAYEVSEIFKIYEPFEPSKSPCQMNGRDFELSDKYFTPIKDFQSIR